MRSVVIRLVLAVALVTTLCSLPVLAAAGVSATPPWTRDGWQTYARMGESVAPAGDVNGDGYSDIIVGAPEYDSTGVNEGRAYVYHGSAAGISLAPDWTGANHMAYSHYGYAVAPAGDVNGDGYGDVIVGAWRSDFGTGLSEQGRAYLYLGSASGLADSASWTFASGQAGARLGWAVGTAGDVNGDGYDDVIVGAPEYDAGSGAVGRVFLFRGGPAGPAASPEWTRDGDLLDAEFGYAVGTAGDVNADGLSDILVGSPGYETALVPGGGRAYLFLGNGTLVSESGWHSVSGVNGARHGHSVAGAGDVNADGYADVVVGAPDYGVGGLRPGRAVVYLGTASGLAASSSWTRSGAHDYADFGWTVATAGDLDGDGFADIVVGTPGYDPTNGERLGRAEVFLGSHSGLTSGAVWSATGTQAWAEYAVSVGTAGDVDGDGFADLVVGHYLWDAGGTHRGRVYVYAGAPEPVSTNPGALLIGVNYEHLGNAVASAGDVNGDGYDDVIVGSPLYNGVASNAGRAQLFMGSAAGLVLSPAWTRGGSQVEERFGHAVAGAGDVNNDGYDDVIVGAPFSTSSATQSGNAHLYLGSATGLGTAITWSSAVGDPGEQVGWSVASAGDVDGDGYGDVVIGAPYYADGVTPTGAAFCYLGNSTGLEAVPADSLIGSQDEGRTGYAVAAADYNGDGFTDVFVGSPFYSEVGLPQIGKVEGFTGSATGVSPSATWTFKGFVAGQRAGWSVAPAGDPSHCGCEAILFGSPWYTEAYTDQGRADLYHSGPCAGAIGTVAFKMHQAFARTGWAVDTGDMDGDGTVDVIVGSPDYTNSFSQEGAARVYTGEGYIPDSATWFKYGGQADANLGYGVAVAGDINGDGFDDIVVSAPDYIDGPGSGNGVVAVYGGGGAGLNADDRVWRPRLLQSDGDPLARLGQSDDDDRVAIGFRGRSAGGRTRARLEWAVQELGALTPGTPARGSWFITGSAGPQGSSQEREEDVTGLSPATDYSLRTRVGSRSPYFPWSRWFTLSRTTWAQKHFRTGQEQVAVRPGEPGEVGPRLLVRTVHPNPFASRTSITFTLPEAGFVRLMVFDLAGRRVATVLEGVREAGDHIASWNGRDETGVPAATGVYFIQVEARGEHHSRKALILR